MENKGGMSNSNYNRSHSTKNPHLSTPSSKNEPKKLSSHSNFENKEPTKKLSTHSSANHKTEELSSQIINSTFSIKDQYKLTNKVLGQGKTGIVVKAKNKISNQFYACKIIPKSKVGQVNNFLNELIYMKKLDHPNLLKLYDVFEDYRNFFLIFEELNGQSVMERLSNAVLTENEVRHIFGQILNSVHYCHVKNITFKNLSLQHFLFINKKEYDLRLYSFGSLKNYRLNYELNSSADNDNFLTTSPEVIHGTYDKSCDVWSLGVILYILVCGKPPFSAPNDNEMKKVVCKGEYDMDSGQWAMVNSDVKKIISSCLCLNPEDRITLDQLAAHHWFEKSHAELKKSSFKVDFNYFENYNNFNKFKKLVLVYITMITPELEVKELKEWFKEVDLNGDGVISFSELNTALKKQGYKNDDEVKEIFESMDIDGSGRIEYTEFLAAMIDKSKYDFSHSKFETTFRYMDKDQNGFIDRDELVKIVGVDNEHVVDYIMDTFVHSGENKLSFEEFKDIMLNDHVPSY